MTEPTYGLQHIRKLCCWCNRSLPLQCFYRNPMTRDRLCPQCKFCMQNMKRAEKKIEKEASHAA